jgi:hypothetical protein
MNIRHRLAKAISYGGLLLSFSGALFAAQLKENSADIQQVINIPGMAININPGGVGCNVVRHEKWEPTQNGCSNIEWVKQTARVISVTASPPSILANNIAASTLTATLVDGDGYLVGFGIPTSWGTSNGWLSTTSTVTDASGKTSVALRGTVAGLATVTAAAVAGAAAANVTLVPDASTSRVVTLAPSPWTVPANWTPAALYATVRDAYNNILPAGQAVYWAATLGSLNTGVSYTDGNGIAVATIASGSAGDSTIYARTAVSNNATTGVNFSVSNPAPTIQSFTEDSEYANKRIPNRLFWDSQGVGIDGGISYGSYHSNIFRWSAINATSYELLDSGGNVMYAGPATSVDINNRSVKILGSDGYNIVWTLRAYNGGQVSTATISMRGESDGSSGGGDGGG